MRHIFNVFGRLIAVEKGGDRWECRWLGSDGKRRSAELAIPSDVCQGELAQYLYDIYHEAATPTNGDVFELLADTASKPETRAKCHAAIRASTPDDASSLIHLHHAAVHGIAGDHYPVEIIEAWSRKPDKARIDWMRELIAQNDSIVTVAEDHAGILGFGIVLVESSELRALYVSPAASGQGVGQALLQSLEGSAAARGIRQLRLNASLNAVDFYRRSGYETLGPSTLHLSDRYEMACTKLCKALTH